MALASIEEPVKPKNRLTKKREQKETTIHPKIDDFWIREWVGHKKMLQDKPKAWSSPPQIGMDKIRAKTDMGKYFVDFASSSSVHGCNHLVAPHRHPIERFLTVLFIGGALLCLILLSLNFWERYQSEAVISIIDNDYRSFTVTKPAVMVCPVEKHDESKFAEVFERHGIEDTEEARTFFGFIANVTMNVIAKTPNYDKVPPEKWLTILWELKGDVETDYPDHTSRSWVVTEKGLCLYFWAYVGEYASYEYWMENNWTVVPIPKKIPSYRYSHRNEVKSLTVFTHSVRVNTFHPLEIPDSRKSDILVGQRHLLALGVVANEVKTSSAAESLSVHQRKCKKPKDGGLRLWPIYTRTMCNLECKYEMMRSKCGCYPHWVRPMPGIPICTAAQLRCVGENRPQFLAMIATQRKKCNCVPNCDTALYEDYPDSDTELKAGSPMNVAINLHIEYPSSIVRRELLFGFTDFLTSVGGAAGLFLGASVISFVEIIYYATLRLFWYRVKIRKRKEGALRMRRIIVERKEKKLIAGQ